MQLIFSCEVLYVDSVPKTEIGISIWDIPERELRHSSWGGGSNI